MRDALTELFKKYESQIFDGNELQCDAHDKLQNARALYSYLFQTTCPPDYLSILPPEATQGKEYLVQAAEDIFTLPKRIRCLYATHQLHLGANLLG